MRVLDVRARTTPLFFTHQAKEMLSYLPEKDGDFRTTQGSLPFASLNQACFADAGVIMVADGVTIEKPIQVHFSRRSLPTLQQYTPRRK